MATTYVDTTASGGQTDFEFTFPYLEDEHVKVEINGVATTAFTIVTSPSTKIVLDTGATTGEIVRVQRVSAPDENLVDFQNGSVLTESELDRAYLHNRYLAEESAEQNDVSMRLKAGAVGWDGLNKRILNIVDPVDEQDVATKNYVDGVIGDVALGEVPDDSITYAKLQDAVGNNVLLGNDNGPGEEIQELSATEVRSLLNVADGAETGTVVSIASGTGLTGGPITTSGTISLAPIANLRALGNVSGGSAAPTAVEIKDEDTMASDSATALATQQSIKAYVDNRKWSSGWFNDSGAGLNNGGTHIFNHTLGTAEINVEVFMAKDASGTDTIKVSPMVIWNFGQSSLLEYGAMVNNVTSSAITVQLSADGWIYYDTNGNNISQNWGTTFTHIKVVATG